MKKKQKKNKKKTKNMENYQKAYIAGGCFWGMEDLFRVRPGIIATEVGYIGGENDYPTYKNHPGHAEGIELTYDATATNFKEILDYFFRIHNPTTIDQQGNDRGSSYRSAIFFQNEEEKIIAQEVIKIVDATNKWEGDAVTTLESSPAFWPAEPEHQDYLLKHPNGYTCHFERFGTFLT
ncbi:MAG: peptide-methionine (S)-S-oxide reductase [Patiriisocius sp.]